MKLIKILAVTAILFVALAFGFRNNNSTEIAEETTVTTKVTPEEALIGPIGMSDDNQF